MRVCLRACSASSLITRSANASILQALVAYTKSLPAVWKKGSSITFSDVSPGATLELSVNVDPVHAWNEGGRIAVAKSNLIFFLYKALGNIGITCLSAPVPTYQLPADAGAGKMASLGGASLLPDALDTSDTAALLRHIRGS